METIICLKIVKFGFSIRSFFGKLKKRTYFKKKKKPTADSLYKGPLDLRFD